MTLLYEFDLDNIKMNHRTKYLCQSSFRSKVIVQTNTHTHTHTHTADRSLYLETQPFSARLLSSSVTTRFQHHNSLQQRPFAGCDAFVRPGPRSTRLHCQHVMSCFYWLHQLRRSRRSLDAKSAATLVHAFVASRIDYCNAVLACAPKATTGKLERVLNAVAQVVTGTKKFEWGLSRLLHTELHWLDVPERVMYKLSVTMYSCLHGQAPQYLLDVYQPVSDVTSQRHLRFAGRRLLNVPHQKRSTFARRAFSVAGPWVWNSLADYLRDPAVSRDTFCKHLKTFLFAVYWYTFSALEVLRRCAI